MRLPSLILLVALAACSPSKLAYGQVKSAMMDAGLSEANSACMAERMTDRLSLGQLQKLKQLKGEKRNLADYVVAVRRVGDAEAIKVTAIRNPGELPHKDLGVDIALDSGPQPGFQKMRRLLEPRGIAFTLIEVFDQGAGFAFSDVDDTDSAFDDPFALITHDAKHSLVENREWLLGKSDIGMLVVIFTIR